MTRYMWQLLILISSLVLNVNAQELNLSSISKLNQIVSEDNMGEMEPEQDIEDNTKDRQKINLEKEDFQTDKFGYKGLNSFDSVSRDKYNPTEEIKFFGYDVFKDAPLTFSQTNDIPIPPDYVLGPGDQIKLILYGNRNTKQNLKINRSGEIYIPNIGPVLLAGSTFEESVEKIKQLVTTQSIGTRVDIDLGKLRSINVFVLGEAISPGMYSISALSSLTNAIFTSGGVKTTGSLRKIEVKRGGELIKTLDFYDLLLRGDTSSDIRLIDGDVIFIPPRGKTVGIVGEVLRPGIYELKQDELLERLVEFAGKFMPKADLASTEIQRIDSSSNGINLIKNDLLEPNNLRAPLFDGDNIVVSPIIEQMNNAVLVSGHAPRSGFYSWYDGLKIGDIFVNYEDLLEMTDTNYVIVKRKNSAKSEYEFLQVDLEKVYADKSSKENIILNNKDEIIFLPILLRIDQIETKLIEENSITDNETGANYQSEPIVTEWRTISQLKKSLLETRYEDEKQKLLDENRVNITQEISSPIEQVNPLETFGDKKQEIEVRRYYDYGVNGYCSLPDHFLSDLTNYFFDLDEFNYNFGQDMNQEEENKDLETLQSELTNLCRAQLVNPNIEIISRQSGLNNMKKIISVYGNVFFPGEYPLSKDMTLEDAIHAAGGYRENTYLSEIEIINNFESNRRVITTDTSLSLKDSLNKRINPSDSINVKKIRNINRVVEVTGEVLFPGTYPISGDQKLSEIIKRAGGLTSSADAQAAFFQRQSIQQAQIERLELAREDIINAVILQSQKQEGQQINENLLSLLNKKGSYDNLGRLVIDLPSILSGGNKEDIILFDGDKLHIPKIQQTISVIGEVYVNNSHIFKDKLGVDDYINLSGGANDYADVSKTYLIKADGRIVSPSDVSGSSFFRGSSSLEPGDTIVVPPDISPLSALAATTEITQIIYQMALAAAAVNSF